MNIKLLVAVALVLSLSATAVQAQTAVYDPATGNVTFSGLDNVGGLRLVGPGVPAVAPDALGGFADTSIDGEVSWLFFAPKAGDVDAGNLLPTQLFQVALESDYQAFQVQTGGGGAQIPMAFTGGLIIPEPASVMLAGLGLIGFVAARRRS